MKRLLLVDNDEMIRTMLNMVFSDAGYHVLLATNGIEALKIHRQKPVHVIVAEMLLPAMDGVEMLMELRGQPAAPKFIAMTAGGKFTVEQYLHLAKQLGAHHGLAKPFKPEQLLAAVRTVLDEA